MYRETFKVAKIYVVLLGGMFILAILLMLYDVHYPQNIQYENIETQQYLEQETEQETD